MKISPVSCGVNNDWCDVACAVQFSQLMIQILFFSLINIRKNVVNGFSLFQIDKSHLHHTTGIVLRKPVSRTSEIFIRSEWNFSSPVCSWWGWPPPSLSRRLSQRLWRWRREAPSEWCVPWTTGTRWVKLNCWRFWENFLSLLQPVQPSSLIMIFFVKAKNCCIILNLFNFHSQATSH